MESVYALPTYRGLCRANTKSSTGEPIVRQQIYGKSVDVLMCQLLIVPAQKKIANAMATARNAWITIRQRVNCRTAQGEPVG